MYVMDIEICKLCETKVGYFNYPCTNGEKHTKLCKTCILKCYENFGKCPYCNEEDISNIYNAHNVIYEYLNYNFPIKCNCIRQKIYKNNVLGPWRKKYTQWLKKYKYPNKDINLICLKNKFPMLNNYHKNILKTIKYNAYLTLLDKYEQCIMDFKFNRYEFLENMYNKKIAIYRYRNKRYNRKKHRKTIKIKNK